VIISAGDNTVKASKGSLLFLVSKPGSSEYISALHNSPRIWRLMLPNAMGPKQIASALIISDDYRSLPAGSKVRTG
jgi:hypothetical protein